MEAIETVLNISEQLRACTNLDEVKKLRKSWNRSSIQNRGKSQMLSDVQLSREADNLIKDVEELTTKVLQETQVEFLTRDLVGENFARYMRSILDLHTNNDASSIGVQGMGGVGKTTLIKHLHNMMVNRPEIYGSVYWITVSKDCSIQKLQNDIANRIGETISDKMISQRAGIIAKALKRKKPFVLILDDMWSDYNLNEVGFGFPKEIGYRLIVTSRSKDLCLKMNCDEIIEVNPLSQKDAWTLFIKSIGHEIPDNLTKISTDVLQECSGMPLAIITLAKSMKGCNDSYQWRNVLNELRNPSGRVDDMEEQVFKVLRWSYDQIKEEEIKKCLLCCALYPEDYRIEMNGLVWMFIDAGLLGKNVELTKMFDKGLTILRKLEAIALLSIETIESLRPSFVEEKGVVLHDLIRDMALQIAGSRFMIKAGNRLKDIPDKESWTNELEVVSLMENHIKEITNFSPRCTSLSMLLIQNDPLDFVSDCFFKCLHGLKHLDLSWSGITTLPKSISLLKNLTSLILGECYCLKTLPSLGKLTSLERLNIWRTRISQLPKGIEKLIKLRYFNLYDTRIKRIGAGVISKLTALQYLAISATFDVEELKSLNHLEHLTILFENNPDRFSKFITQMTIAGRPNSYNFIFGNDRVGIKERISYNWWSEKQIFIDRGPRREVFYCMTKPFKGNMGSLGCRPSNPRGGTERERSVKLFLGDQVQEVLQDINILVIEDDDLMSLGDLVWDSALNLQRPSEMKRGPKPFSNVETLVLSGCSHMKKALGLLTNLQNIQQIKISWCLNLEALIEEADDETTEGRTGFPPRFSLPKLKHLELNDLPNLGKLCSNGTVIHTPSLRWMCIESCWKLKRMPFDVDNQRHPFPQMHFLRRETEWVESLEWDPPQSKSRISFIPSRIMDLSMNNYTGEEFDIIDS